MLAFVSFNTDIRYALFLIDGDASAATLESTDTYVYWFLYLCWSGISTFGKILLHFKDIFDISFL